MIQLTDFDTIAVHADYTKDEKVIKEIFDAAYEEFLGQCDILPDRQFEKIKYVFNIVKIGLGDAIVEDKETFDMIYDELNQIEKKRFARVLLDQKIIAFRKTPVITLH